MKWDHVIKNGTIVDSPDTYTGHIYINNGKIAAISAEELGGTAMQTTDAAGQYVFPGFIDTHIHSRDPGPTYKEDFFHSTMAAAAGGVTTVFEMPNTAIPVSTKAYFEQQVENLTPKAHVDFALWAICLGHLNLNHIQELNEAGVIAFKFFWGYAVHEKTYQLVYNYKPGMKDVIPPFKDGEVYDMFTEVAKTGKRLAIHAENHELIEHLTERMEKSGRTDYQAMLDSRPNLVEESTVQTGISFARSAGTKLHILHVSTKEAVEHIKRAQQEGLPITAETCPQYLFLSNEDYDRVGPTMKIYPLIKYKEDQERLWEALQEGVIQSVCSDHAPHTEEEKDGDLWSIPAGMCGVETLAPLLIDAVSTNKISVHELADVLAVNPAKLFNIYPAKGSLKPGTDADITIVDFRKKHQIKRENLHSKSKITAYDGLQIQGLPVATFVRGTKVMEHGQIISKPHGKIVKPSI